MLTCEGEHFHHALFYQGDVWENQIRRKRNPPKPVV